MKKVVIGNCTLIHGDCLEVVKELDLSDVDMIFTDPPYNFDMRGGIGKLSGNVARLKERIIDITDFSASSIAFFKDLDIGSFYFFCNNRLVSEYLNVFNEMKSDILCWCKTDPPPFNNYNFLNDIEYLMYFYKKGRVWNNGLKPLSVYKKYYVTTKNIARRDVGDLHPTMKPVPIIEDKILISSREGKTVLDTFMGSGSTAIACINTNRKFIGVEIDKERFDIACEWISDVVKNRQHQLELV